MRGNERTRLFCRSLSGNVPRMSQEVAATSCSGGVGQELAASRDSHGGKTDEGASSRLTLLLGLCGEDGPDFPAAPLLAAAFAEPRRRAALAAAPPASLDPEVPILNLVATM